MADSGFDFFSETVTLDASQEVDRICMSLIEVKLRNIAHDCWEGETKKSSYWTAAKELRKKLYGLTPDPSVQSAANSDPESAASSDPEPADPYPAQHLLYWFGVRADYWGTVTAPPAGNPEQGAAIDDLLKAAERLKRLIDSRSSPSGLSPRRVGSDDTNSSEEGATLSEDKDEALRAQKDTLNTIISALSPPPAGGL